jgi:hypothetical protein
MAPPEPHSGPGFSATENSTTAVSLGYGKCQPWKSAWPPSKSDLAGVVESRGQMLLLDGTGGSGTVAVPNAVKLPPKPKEK